MDYQQNSISVHLNFTLYQFLRPRIFQQDTLAVTRFNAHQSTIYHKDAVLKTITLPKTTQDIRECLSRQHVHENREWRQCLLKLLSNIRFFVRQSLLLHGDGMNPKVTMYNCRSCEKRMIPEYMTGFEERLTNILHQRCKTKWYNYGFKVLWELASFLHATPSYMVMKDETTDVSNCEQVMFFSLGQWRLWGKWRIYGLIFDQGWNLVVCD